MIVYRISRRIYSKDLSGVGAGLYGGRWNPPGINLLYTAGSISLCYLEYLAHNIHLLINQEVCLIKIEVNDPVPILEPDFHSLPHDWDEKSYTPQSTMKYGSELVIENKHYLLKVPSAIVPQEFNYLLNPNHEEHSQTKVIEIIDPFKIDARMLLKSH